MSSGAEHNWRRTEDGWRLLPGVYVGTGSGAVPAFDLERVRNTCSRNKLSKTEANNNVRIVQIAGANRPHDVTNQERCDSLIPVRQPYLDGIKGIGIERRIWCGLSTAFGQLEIADIVMEISGTRYCCEFFCILLREKIGKLTGTTLRMIFRVLQKVVSEALNNEVNINIMAGLLETVSEALSTRSHVGSRSLWKRHHDVVNNLATQVRNFQYTQREDDDLPHLLDLPKECLHNILRRISDPRDLANVGASCSYLHDLTEDRFIWQDMCLFHFTDKQLYPFIYDDEYLGIDWFKTFQLCYKKNKRLQVDEYANELYFCNLCRAVFWKDLGHPCRNPNEKPDSSPLLPRDFIGMLCL
ncbi:F-box only protein 32-like [Pecten maximus]|uniref:F-box only protein 32-like n=1 Tax=Pecten maximus TaxID=6579 RepID=UPI001458E84E|nr:F-box only protein 32-like [Pecten maximus]